MYFVLTRRYGQELYDVENFSDISRAKNYIKECLNSHDNEFISLLKEIPYTVKIEVGED